eukprot:209297-Amorphochlora_amoeboformis.AAC.3
MGPAAGELAVEPIEPSMKPAVETASKPVVELVRVMEAHDPVKIPRAGHLGQERRSCCAK